MLGLTKKQPILPPFTHADDCKILKTDPGVEIEWSEMERGHWVATCRCGEQHYREPTKARVRQDPLDPKTTRHLPQCEFAGETDSSVLRVLLKVQDKETYAWVMHLG